MRDVNAKRDRLNRRNMDRAFDRLQLARANGYRTRTSVGYGRLLAVEELGIVEFQLHLDSL